MPVLIIKYNRKRTFAVLACQPEAGELFEQMVLAFVSLLKTQGSSQIRQEEAWHGKCKVQTQKRTCTCAFSIVFYG